MSIRVRLLAIIGIISLIASLCFAYISYRFSVDNAMREAKNTGEIILNYTEASLIYFKKHQRPLIMEILEDDRFFPEIMSGFALTRGVWEQFSKKTSNYIFKQASIDPRFPDNKADEDELNVINYFRDNPNSKTREGIIEKNGSSFFYFARPIMMKKGCLKCHGDPADAPKDQLEIYGEDSGYFWKVGDIVASFIIYVPIQKALDSAKKSAVTLFLIGTSGIIILMFFIWLCVNKLIINSLKMLEERTTEISLGKNMDIPITTGTDDEIGSLARAIDRLRISIIKVLKRYRK